MKRLRTFLVVPLVFASALALAACGSASVKSPVLPSNSSKPVASLCHEISRVDGLKVTRHAPGNEFVFSFPAEVEVNNVAEARSVAAATCALADFPPGSFSCPVAFAISYQLDFAVRGEEGTGGDAATLDPTGCQMVTGLGATRVPSSSFYKLLAEAMGLKHHGYRIFQGVIPKSG